MTGSGGERDLGMLLAHMAPTLSAERHDFRLLAPDESPFGDGKDSAEIGPENWPRSCFALIREEEGIGAVIADPAGAWARITLRIHSSLEAVGLTAAFSAALTKAGIPSNVIAGLYHDHLLVPWDRRHEAMAALEALRCSGETPS